MAMLETSRLLLRPFRMDDLADFYAYASNPDVGPGAGWKPHESMEESRQLLPRFVQDKLHFAMEEKSSGHVIGAISLRRDEHRDHNQALMLGYVLDSSRWGRGYMPEAAKAVIRYAFDELDISVLGVQHYPFNAASRRVIEKCGFTYEGTLRQAKVRYYDGLMLDLVCYSMTREEFEAMRGEFE